MEQEKNTTYGAAFFVVFAAAFFVDFCDVGPDVSSPFFAVEARVELRVARVELLSAGVSSTCFRWIGVRQGEARMRSLHDVVPLEAFRDGDLR